MSKFAQGIFQLKNPEKYVGLKSPRYRSSWEWHFMKTCDEHPSVEKWASESIKIPYKDPLTGRATVYVPDFFIVYTDKGGKKHTELIEIKPANQMIIENVGKNVGRQMQYIKNMAKWEAARAWCSQNGIFFRIMNENDLFHQGKKR
jgi:TnsA endonuclease N terminal